MISVVDATMAMEGMALTDEDKDRIHSVLTGKCTVEMTVQELIRKHSQKAELSYERV